MESGDARSLLRRAPLFGGLPEALFDDLAGLASARRIAKGTVLFSEGERVGYLPVLLVGKVKLTRAGADGREQVLHVVRAPASFAEAAVFGPGVFPADAVVLTSGILATIPQDRLLGLMRSRPEIAFALLASMSMWLRRLVDLVEGLSLHTVEERVAAYLWSTFVRSGQPLVPGTTVRLEDPKHLIAALCGTGPEVLSRTFRKLEEGGAASVAGPTAVLLDPGRLRALADTAEA
jgi:CRP/FNR family transcriptional regulator